MYRDRFCGTARRAPSLTYTTLDRACFSGFLALALASISASFLLLLVRLDLLTLLTLLFLRFSDFMTGGPSLEEAEEK